MPETLTSSECHSGQRAVHLYQIAYSDETFASVPAMGRPLDNRLNERPDWREYWPIRNFLLTASLDENALYGFFSPKFSHKTGLSYEQAIDFVRSADANTEVFLFSPQPDIGALFLNVFEGNDLFDPGFLAASQEFVNEIGLDVNLRGIVMESRNVAFSNFVIATPKFWRAWLEINEKLFDICEGRRPSAVADALNAGTSYPGAVARKVFLMERLTSLLLATGDWKSTACNPFRMAWSAHFSKHMVDAIISDALKIAYRETGFSEYLGAFNQVRKRVFPPT